MMNLVEKLKVFFLASLELGETEALASSPIQFIKSQKGLQRELLFSKQTGYVVGIYSPALGDGMFLTTVEDLFTAGDDTIVVLKPRDLHGLSLPRTHLSIKEVECLCPFNTVYTNPATKEKHQPAMA